MRSFISRVSLIVAIIFTSHSIGLCQSMVFQNLANIGIPRSGMGTATDGTYIYLSNGFSNTQGFTTMLERYDIASNTWSTFSNSLISKRYPSSVVVNNNLYVINGDDGTAGFNAKVEVIDLTNASITFATDNPYPAQQAGIAKWANEIYVFGGTISGGLYSNRLYKFDPVSDVWTRLADMPVAKQTRGEIINGKLYTIGGFNGLTTTSIDVYDIATNTWSFAMNIPVGISSFDIAAYANRIWVIGDFTNLTNTACYDVAANTYTIYTNNMIGRRHNGAEIINGKLYAICGSQTSALSSSLTSLQSLDLVSFLCGTTVTPEICMVTTDSLSTNNVIYWDKTAYPMADSFIVYRDTANNDYARIGSVSKNSLSLFNDTARNIGFNGGDPNVSSWRYKISIIDTCGNESFKSPYHQTMFFQLGTGNFSWTHYGIEGQASPVPNLNNYYVKMDTFAISSPGNWNLIQSLSASSTSYTYPGYSTYQSTADWRVETNWSIGCNLTLRLANGNQNEIQTTVVKSKSNIKNNRTVGIKDTKNQEARLKVYPNPANDLLNVEVSLLNEKEATISIENMLGQVVHEMKTTQNLNQLNISTFVSGVYFVKVKADNKVISTKLIIQQ